MWRYIKDTNINRLFIFQYLPGKEIVSASYPPTPDNRMRGQTLHLYCTVCPGNSDPFYIVTYYIKWVTTSWTYSTTQLFYVTK